MISTTSTPIHELNPEQQLKAYNAFLGMTINPATFDAVYDMDEVLRETNLSEIACAYIQSQPGVTQIIKERYLAPVPDLDELLTYPRDSLGYIFATHLKANHFDPVFYRPRAVKDNISYLSLRRSQTHDIYHVITGFDTNLEGEIGLQAFQLAQFRSPIAIPLIAASLINQLGNDINLQKIMTQIHLGWEMGLAAKPLMAEKWEEAWEKPLIQWQAELNIRPINSRQLHLQAPISAYSNRVEFWS